MIYRRTCTCSCHSLVVFQYSDHVTFPFHASLRALHTLDLVAALKSVFELPLGNCASSVLRYDNALRFLDSISSYFLHMPYSLCHAYLTIPWNQSHVHGSH